MMASRDAQTFEEKLIPGGIQAEPVPRRDFEPLLGDLYFFDRHPAVVPLDGLGNDILTIRTGHHVIRSQRNRCWDKDIGLSGVIRPRAQRIHRPRAFEKPLSSTL